MLANVQPRHSGAPPNVMAELSVVQPPGGVAVNSLPPCRPTVS